MGPIERAAAWSPPFLSSSLDKALGLQRRFWMLHARGLVDSGVLQVLGLIVSGSQSARRALSPVGSLIAHRFGGWICLSTCLWGPPSLLRAQTGLLYPQVSFGRGQCSQDLEPLFAACGGITLRHLVAVVQSNLGATWQHRKDADCQTLSLFTTS